MAISHLLSGIDLPYVRVRKFKETNCDGGNICCSSPKESNQTPTNLPVEVTMMGSVPIGPVAWVPDGALKS